MIPKLLHVIWVGDESIRPDNCINTWRRHHPDWEFRLWDNAALGGSAWRNADHMRAMAKREINGVADLMRWEILASQGGIVVDADSVCVRPLPEWLLECEAFACWENELDRPGLIAAGYVGSAPRNPFFANLVESIHETPCVVDRMAWQTVGPQRLTEAFRDQAYTGLTILPSHFFIPAHFAGRTYTGSGPVYALQEWASTRRSYGTLHAKDVRGMVGASRSAEAAGDARDAVRGEIPKRIHWIWLGLATMPTEYTDYIDRAMALHPDWECRVWRDEDVRALASWPLIERAPTWAGKSDIARYEILASHGGVYLDCDVELLRSLEPVRTMGDLVVCNEDENFDRYCSISFIAAAPGHPALRRAVETLYSVDPTSGPPNRVTGPWFWRTCLDGSHKQLETAAFYPYLYDEPREVLADRDLSRSFGIHHWAGSWLDLDARLGVVEGYIRNGYFVAAAARLEELRAEAPDSAGVIERIGLLHATVAATIVKAVSARSSPPAQLLGDLGHLRLELGSLEATAQLLVQAAKAADAAVAAASAAAAGGAPLPPPKAAPPRDDTAWPKSQARDHRLVVERIKRRLRFRPGSDDDRFVIPELLEMNMFRFDELIRLAPPEPLAVVDCGAHIGVFSALAAAWLPQAEVHAFEPQPDSFELLRSNAQTLGDGRIVARCQAVGFESGYLPLYRSGTVADGFTGRWSMTPEAEDLSVIDRVDVEVIDLFAFLESLDRPIFALKLDLEGFEADILARMPATLLSRIGVLILEVHHRPIEHSRLNSAGLRLAFQPLGSARHFVYINPAALLPGAHGGLDSATAVRQHATDTPPRRRGPARLPGPPHTPSGCMTGLS